MTSTRISPWRSCLSTLPVGRSWTPTSDGASIELWHEGRLHDYVIIVRLTSRSPMFKVRIYTKSTFDGADPEPHASCVYRRIFGEFRHALGAIAGFEVAHQGGEINE